MVGQAGGYVNVEFTKKDLDNHIQRTRRAKLIGGGSNAAISYVLGKVNVDPMAMARADYQCFGNVLAFDTTYQKNKYRRPLVIFSGCNHHRQTCIFGFALVEDERTATYMWLLQNLLEVMLNKSPSVVVIDGDESLLELVQNLEHALRDYRHNELVSQFKTVNGEPILTTGLEALELSVANFYTREILGEVKKEIQGVVTLDIINEEKISTTVVLKVKECDRRQHIYNVLYDRNTEHMECECSRWSSEGIPCSHIFCAMKSVGLQKFPDSLLLKRWSKDTKEYLDESSAGGTPQDREREFLMRYGALSVVATWMVFLGAQDGPSFYDTMNEVCRWTQTLEQKSGLKRQTRDSPMPNFVGDPSVVKTKGAPKGEKERGNRRCTKCNNDGHV
ncbi:protein FAR1-RELATED SEQUENCE 9-like [Arachis ipaensis]|uniref:SWIM-type domain-containing protein n=1 Tax=Arachis hypogaea TaxID=3818 RepID=A0A444X4Y9_ARAHY|nr:protein FAR1-RELATED SEQUENCE 9-like [Arachis ipaensis]RYQ84719.1 hypothetical protein Ahy_B10g104188 [Arachis hypogaea]